jgi:hypothetical protein
MTWNLIPIDKALIPYKLPSIIEKYFDKFFNLQKQLEIVKHQNLNKFLEEYLTILPNLDDLKRIRLYRYKESIQPPITIALPATTDLTYERLIHPQETNFYLKSPFKSPYHEAHDNKYTFIKNPRLCGFGKVFLAKRKVSNRLVAIKQLLNVQVRAGRYNHEIEIVSRFENPNVVTYYHLL